MEYDVIKKTDDKKKTQREKPFLFIKELLKT
jgi:hypothetical protein